MDGVCYKNVDCFEMEKEKGLEKRGGGVNKVFGS